MHASMLYFQNVTAYFDTDVSYAGRMFTKLTPGASAVKPFTSVIYGFLMFVPGMLFKPGLTNTLAYYENSKITDKKVL